MLGKNIGRRMAKLAALRSEHPKWRLGACLIKNGAITIAPNSDRSAPFTKRYYYRTIKIHAEANCIGRSELGSLSGADLYVCRLKKDGSFGLALPCSGCLELIRIHRIKRVFYTTQNNDWGLIKI